MSYSGKIAKKTKRMPKFVGKKGITRNYSGPSASMLKNEMTANKVFGTPNVAKAMKLKK